MNFATWYTIFNVWGSTNPTFSGTLSLVSYWILVILSNVNVGIKSGSLYLREKLDQDAEDTPAGRKSIWSAPPRRLLFVVGIYILFGINMGTFSVSTIVHICMGVADRFIAVPYYVAYCALF
jgi:hypothetical protein